MPIYEYVCQKCQEAFELWSTFKEVRSKEACPTCGTPSEKVISTFGLYRIKGNNSASTPPKTTGTKK